MAAEKVGSVYAVVHLATARFYVGQTVRTVAERWSKHLDAARRGLDTHFARAIRTYGSEAFRVFEIARAPKSELDACERHWIAELGAMHPRTGFNMTRGGDANPMEAPELRAKVSAALKGRPKPEIAGDAHHMRLRPESRAKVSAALKGKYTGDKSSMWGRSLTPEHRQKLIEAASRPKSAEHIAKMAANRRGKSWTPAQREAIMAARAASDAVKANNARLGREAADRQRGRPITEAHREAIRHSNRTRWVKDGAAERNPR